MRTSPDDVFVTNGSQQAIDVIARVLLEPGDTVAVEDPGYPLPRRVFRADATILEDDYDSEFRYGGRPLDPLRALDGTGRVLYVGSFSKTMLPILRLGFAVVLAPLHAAFRKAKALMDWHTAVPVQAAAADLIEDGLLAQHIRRMRRVYTERHERILGILDREFAEHLSPGRPPGACTSPPSSAGATRRSTASSWSARGVAEWRSSRSRPDSSRSRPGPDC